MDIDRPNYQRLYPFLFGAISDALDILPCYPGNEQVYSVLKNALLTAEELYISSTDVDETKEN